MTSERPSTALSPTVAYHGEGHLFATWKNVLIGIWTAAGTMRAAEELGRLGLAFDEAHPEGTSTIHVLANRPGLPPADVREKLGELLRMRSARLACFGVVIEDSGFWGSALRSFVTGLRLLAPRTFRMHIYGTRSELARWLPDPHAEKTGVRLESVELERVLEELRARVA